MWKTSWQRKRFLSEILRLWKKRGLGIAVILGHLMHSNGGPFTTSFYLNGPKSRGRKQLNNKLQIRFSLSRQFYIQTPPLLMMLMMVILERNKSNVVDDEDPGREERAGQWMFMGNVGVVDNWKAIFTPIAFLSHSFSFVLPFKNKKKVQNHLFSKTGIKRRKWIRSTNQGDYPDKLSVWKTETGKERFSSCKSHRISSLYESFRIMIHTYLVHYQCIQIPGHNALLADQVYLWPFWSPSYTLQ